ncbi:MAG: hypothetical protein ACLVKA_05715 [Collinsella aerofaciens]
MSWASTSGNLRFHLLTGGVELTQAALGTGTFGIQTTLTRRDLLKPRLYLALARHALGKARICAPSSTSMASSGEAVEPSIFSIERAWKRPVGSGRHPRIQAHNGADGVDGGGVPAAGQRIQTLEHAHNLSLVLGEAVGNPETSSFISATRVRA